jgi:AcrR family transcriptional regulator
MPRTVNVETHQERRDAFLDVAERLIMTKGYEQMNVQDVLDALETSKGAFYHYFDSKLALLDAVVDRFGEAGMASVVPILDDPDLPALRKLERILESIARFKAEQKELVLAIMQVWTADGNALFREKIRQLTARWLARILVRIIEQGIDEGVIQSGSPEETATVLICLIQGYPEVASRYLLARQAGRVTFAEVTRTYAAFTRAFERILGVPEGSLTLVDEATVRFWFG